MQVMTYNNHKYRFFYNNTSDTWAIKEIQDLLFSVPLKKDGVNNKYKRIHNKGNKNKQ